jgi:hypothetical protein
MSVFRHPHLVRGIVQTYRGRFAISRGLVDVPDEVGEFYGWLRLEEPETSLPVPPTRNNHAVERDADESSAGQAR